MEISVDAMNSEDGDAHVHDAEAIEEEHRQYGHGPVAEADLDKLYAVYPSASHSSAFIY